MFEKYNEKARRALFFARYEASKLGSKVIESEHLLLGILREGEDIIKEIKKHSYFLKPGERRRIKQALARKRMREKMRRELS